MDDGTSAWKGGEDGRRSIDVDGLPYDDDDDETRAVGTRQRSGENYRKQEKKTGQKSTAPGIPRRSPIQVLTGPDVA